MTNAADDAIERLARQLHARGLATPALMLLDTFAPLAGIGEHALTALGPFVPSRWGNIDELVASLREDHERERLRSLLENVPDERERTDA